MKKAVYRFGDNKAVFAEGMRAGIPIALGYLAVSFSLGIAAHNIGLSALQATLISFLCNASAGEKAAFDMIAVNASYIEMAVMVFIANARYLLMSCALSQRMEYGLSIGHRLAIGSVVVDEIFGVTIARNGYVNPYYCYGAMALAVPAWSLGTLLGAVAGDLLPALLVSAFSVALYGMFIAIIIPPARRDRIVALLIALCFGLSYAASTLPYLRDIPSGTRTIILTAGISAAAALLFPHIEESEIADNDA